MPRMATCILYLSLLVGDLDEKWTLYIIELREYGTIVAVSATIFHLKAQTNIKLVHLSCDIQK
jgi:hypothetical protein